LDSNFAVKSFFTISGFLVTKSFLASRNTLEFAEKRLRRIYPAYFIAVVLCLCLGLSVTTLNTFEFISHPQTLKYALANLTFLNFVQPVLPAVFETHPVQALNGSLWTIKVEIMLYFCVPTLMFFFKRIGYNVTTFVVFLLSVAWVYFFTFEYSGNKGDEIARQFPGQLSYFVLGSFFAVNKNPTSVTKPILLASTLALFITNNNVLKLFIDPIAYSSIIIYFSTAACRDLNLGRYGDISYGLYLYHFPVIQLLIFLGAFKFNVWIGFAATIAITVTTSFASWHFVEKKLLKRSSNCFARKRQVETIFATRH
jgi:peptidoglycan/LPS O-acetylase OafA/YrhL